MLYKLPATNSSLDWAPSPHAAHIFMSSLSQVHAVHSIKNRFLSLRDVIH